jgi:uncharacterized protein
MARFERNILRRILWGLGILVFVGLQVGCNKPDDVPLLTGRVTDVAKVLSAQEAARIEALIREYDKATGGQFTVLIADDLKGESIEAYGTRVFDKWKVGNAKRDDGVIFILAVKDQKDRLEVGRGLEGQINDAKAGDLLRQVKPLLKERRWAAAVTEVIRGCAKYQGKVLAGSAPVTSRSAT